MTDNQKNNVTELLLKTVGKYAGHKDNVFVATESYSTPKIGNNTPSVAIGANSGGGVQAVAIGKQALGVGYTSFAEGYQATALGGAGIAIGTNANVLTHVTSTKTGPNYDNLATGISMGTLSRATGTAIAMGGVASAWGNSSIAIGTSSAVVSDDTKQYAGHTIRQNQEIWVDYLKHTLGDNYGDAYNGWHVYDKAKGLEPLKGADKEKWDKINQDIRTYFKSYLDYINFSSWEKTDTNRADQIMSALRYQYFMEVKDFDGNNRHQPIAGTAIGRSAVTSVTGGVALGYLSLADRGGFTSQTDTPFSHVDLNGKTTGAFSIGNKNTLRQLINLADGTQATDAVNLRQLQAAIDGIKNSGSGASVVVTTGDQNIVIDSKDTADAGGKAIHTYSLKLAPNVMADSFSVKNGPVMNQDGIAMNDKRITGLADGVAPTDAVNVRQLKSLDAKINNSMEEARRTGALSAALSALKPLAYQEGADKWQIMAGTGGYKGYNGIALGLANTPNRNTLLHGGVAFMSGNLMWNAGVTLRMGSDGYSDLKDVTNSKTYASIEDDPQYQALLVNYRKVSEMNRQLGAALDAIQQKYATKASNGLVVQKSNTQTDEKR